MGHSARCAGYNIWRIKARVNLRKLTSGGTNRSWPVFFEWNGHRWDGGQTSHARLSPVLAVAKAGGIACRFFWTDADNQDVAVTAEELIELEVQMLQAMVSRDFAFMRGREP